MPPAAKAEASGSDAATDSILQKPGAWRNGTIAHVPANVTARVRLRARARARARTRVRVRVRVGVRVGVKSWGNGQAWGQGQG